MSNIELYVKAETIRDYEKGKKVEIRPWAQHLRRIIVGEQIYICSSVVRLPRRVVRKTQYQGYESLMRHERFSDIFPGVMDERTFILRVGRTFCLEKLKQQAIVVFELVVA